MFMADYDIKVPSIDTGDLQGFFKHTWGILTAISIALSNIITWFIPIGSNLPRSVFSGVVLVVTFFIVLLTFGERHEFKSIRNGGTELQKTWRNKAKRSFSIAFLLFGIYLIINFAVLAPMTEFMDTSKHGMDSLLQAALSDSSVTNSNLSLALLESVMAVTTVGLLAIYSICFGLITRSFMILGMIEYLEFLDALAPRNKRALLEDGYG
jgi:hypothetical protein